MPNRIGSTRPVLEVVEPELTVPQPPVTAWSSANAAETFKHLESSWGRGVFPDLPAVERDLAKLHGSDLLRGLELLERDGKLDDVIGEMTPAERQSLVNQAIAADLLERKPPRTGKLKAQVALPESFQKMVDDLNSLGANSRRTEDTTYNWSSYQETVVERFDRSARNQVASLKPGDSVEVSGLGEAHAAPLLASGEAKIGITRLADGRFRVHAEGAADLGLNEATRDGRADGTTEATVGAAARLELDLPTASAAYAAAKDLAVNPALASKYGQPAAIEVKGNAAFELAGHFGTKLTKALELAAKGDGELSARLELDHEKPHLVFRAASKGSVEVAGMLGHEPFETKAYAATEKAEGKIELEARFELKKGATLESVRKDAGGIGAEGDYKLTLSREVVHGDRSHSTEASFSTRGAELNAFFVHAGTKGIRSALLTLPSRLELEVKERDVESTHTGRKLEVDLHGNGVEVGAGLETRRIKVDRQLYKGSPRDLLGD